MTGATASGLRPGGETPGNPTPPRRRPLWGYGLQITRRYRQSYELRPRSSCRKVSLKVCTEHRGGPIP